MSYTLKWEPREGYLYFFLEGEDSLKDAFEYWKTIADKSAELGYKKILVEEDLVGQVSEAEMYMLTSKFPDLGLLGLKIAFVDRKTSDKENNEFGELVASNRGIVCRIYFNTDDAEKWLLGE